MKNYFIICFLLTSLLFAQNQEREQSIELPDFVITGVQSVDVPNLIKKKAEFIPLLDSHFLKPRFQSENLNLGTVDAPFPNAPDLFQNYSPSNFSVNLMGGIHTLPAGNIFANMNFKNLLLSANFSGSRILEYSPNSDRNSLNGKITADYYNSCSSAFLPGVLLSLEAEYGYDAYRNFASVNPLLERERQNIGGGFIINYDRDKFFNFAIGMHGEYLWMPENNLGNSNISSEGIVKFIMPELEVKIKGKLIHNNLEDDVISKISEDFFAADADVLFKLSNQLFVGGGIHISDLDANSFFSPKARLIYKVNDFVTLSGEVFGEADYISFSDLIKRNRYYKPLNNYSAYTENRFGFLFNLKYEFENYFGISGNVGYSDFNNFYYFEDDSTNGIFDISSAVDVKKIFLEGNFYFNPGPYGALYGAIKFQQIKFTDDNKVPYEPLLKSTIEYKYSNIPNLKLGLKYFLMYDVFLDRLNTNKLDTYQNLSFNASYEVMKNMEIIIDLQNILNKDNFIWNGYKEKPLDLLFGFKYKW